MTDQLAIKGAFHAGTRGSLPLVFTFIFIYKRCSRARVLGFVFQLRGAGLAGGSVSDGAAQRDLACARENIRPPGNPGPGNRVEAVILADPPKMSRIDLLTFNPEKWPVRVVTGPV